MSQEPSKKRVMTVKEVSEYLKIPTPTVYELAQRGKIKGVKFGKHWRFLEEDILDYLYGRSPTGRSIRNPQERRQYPRINTRISTTLSSLIPNQNQSSIQGIIHNLSEGGVLAEAKVLDDCSFRVGDPVKMSLVVNSASPEMEVEGRVVHQEGGLGIKFRHLSQSTQEVIRHYVG